eukprot:c7746_g1_i2.p1 GENE.c7746_g1_i2~~c7746_g1_i2.p1  ORF type:complete len:167 (-),score=32.60 c7746_g1_i2:151-651(-)
MERSFWVVKGIKEREIGDGALIDVSVSLPSSINDPVRRRKSWPKFWTTTSTGYLQGGNFDACMKKFVELWRLHPGLRVWVFVDGLACHKQLELVRFALDQGVEMWLPPANTSHFLQPLDDKPFAYFKKTLNSRSSGASFGSILCALTPQNVFFGIAYTAEEDAFTE